MFSRPSVRLFVCLCLSVRPSVSLSICRSVCLSVRPLETKNVTDEKQLNYRPDVVYMKRLSEVIERATIGLSFALLISMTYLLQDKTCIVWDLSKLTYVRQLSQHMAPITAICINDLTVS